MGKKWEACISLKEKKKNERGKDTCWLRLRGQIVRIMGKNQKEMQTDLLLCNAKVRYEVVRNSV
jgi:hypothetical protein